MATALVIGGSGQIGRAAVAALVADGWDVRVLTRDGERHGSLVRSWGAEPVVGDRRVPDTLARALRGGVDVLVDVVAFDDRDAEGVLAHRDLVGSAVVVSSAAVYVDAVGDGFETERFGTYPDPIGEDQPTVAPGRGGYAAGKVALEQAWLAAADVPATVLRPGAVHGPGCVQPREWLFVKQALDGRRVRVLSYDGSSRFQTTSTAVIGELVRRAAARPGRRVLNAADPRALTVAEIADAVGAHLGHAPRTVTFAGPPVGPVGATPWSVPGPVVLDGTRAADELGCTDLPGYRASVGAAIDDLLAVASRVEDWREAFGGFARMEAAMGPFLDYAAEDAWLATHEGRSAMMEP